MGEHDRVRGPEQVGERAPLPVRRKALLVAIASLLLIGQCCCCIIPTGGYIAPLLKQFGFHVDVATLDR